MVWEMKTIYCIGQTLNRILVVKISDNPSVITGYEYIMFLWLAVPQNGRAPGGEVRDLQHLICYLKHTFVVSSELGATSPGSQNWQRLQQMSCCFLTASF
jgi:hypothetical protein